MCRLHILAGVFPNADGTRTECNESLWRETYLQNLQYASQRVALVSMHTFLCPFKGFSLLFHYIKC